MELLVEHRRGAADLDPHGTQPTLPYGMTGRTGGFLDPLEAASYNFFMNLLDARRRAPRISVDAFCGVASDHDLQYASLSNLSANGLRIERVYDAATAKPVVQLEIELPGIDEVLWTSAKVTRTILTRMGDHADGRPRYWGRVGLVIGDTSRRDRRLLREFVIHELVMRRTVADRRQLS